MRSMVPETRDFNPQKPTRGRNLIVCMLCKQRPLPVQT